MYASLFAYPAGATFLLQGPYGLSATGLLGGVRRQLGWVHGIRVRRGRLASRWSERGTVLVGIAMSGVGAIGLLATVLDVPLALVLASLWIHASGIACASPGTTSLALMRFPEMAGTASACGPRAVWLRCGRRSAGWDRRAGGRSSARNRHAELRRSCVGLPPWNACGSAPSRTERSFGPSFGAGGGAHHCKGAMIPEFRDGSDLAGTARGSRGSPH